MWLGIGLKISGILKRIISTPSTSQMLLENGVDGFLLENSDNMMLEA